MFLIVLLKYYVWHLERSNSWKKINGIILEMAYPAGIYLFKVNKGYTRTMCEICSSYLSLSFISKRFHIMTMYWCFHRWFWVFLDVVLAVFSWSHFRKFLPSANLLLKVVSAIKLFLSKSSPWCVINDFFHLKKECFVLEISRFLFFCEIHGFQNLWRHRRHWYIMEVTLMLISFES